MTDYCQIDGMASSPKKPRMTTKTPAMILQELSIKRTGYSPLFSLVHQIEGTHENEFHFEVDVLGIRAKGKGRSKKEAKQDTARNALHILKKESPDDDDMIEINEEDTKLPQVINYIGILGDACLLHNLPTPVYIEILAIGPSHAMIFTYDCQLGSSLRTRSTCNTKRQAKQNAAKEMYERIQDILPSSISYDQDKSFNLTDEEVAEKQDLLSLNIVNLGLIISEYSSVLPKLVAEKQIDKNTIETLRTDQSASNLKEFIKLLELKYVVEEVSYNKPYYIYALNIIAEVPLCVLGQSRNREDAITQTFQKMCTILYDLLQ